MRAEKEEILKDHFFSFEEKLQVRMETIKRGVIFKRGKIMHMLKRTNPQRNWDTGKDN